MKNEKQYRNQEKTQTKGGRWKFSRLPNLIFRSKGDLPIPSTTISLGGRSKKSQFMILAFAIMVIYTIKEVIRTYWGEQILEAFSDELSYRYTDEDYLLSEDSTICLLPSVLMEDYRAFEKAEAERDSLIAIMDHLANHDLDLSAPVELLERPKINVDRLVYFERLTKDRVRLIYNNGVCEIYDFKDMLYNIQEEKQCLQFEPIPRNGQVTEYINLLYLESFDRIKCESKELYRVRMGVTPTSCAALRSIMDCGVGLFSRYVYRKLRFQAEQLNPHVNFKYRQTVELEDCEC